MTLRVLSLGAGVQSTTLYLMAEHGQFNDKPDCAIFADTQGETIKTYAHLRGLPMTIPIYQVSKGDLASDFGCCDTSIQFLLNQHAFFAPILATSGGGR